MKKSEYQNNIILKLRKLREEHGYSQEKVALLLGISNGHIGNIESTKTQHKYTLSQIYTICKELNFPVEHVFLTIEELSDNTDIINLLINKIIEYER